MRLLPGHSDRSPDGAARVRRASEAERRQKILRATGEAVAKRGYHGTTIEHIVEAAGTSYGSFYKHFADKEAAFLALFDRYSEHLLVKMGDAYDRPDAWTDRLAAALRCLFSSVAKEPVLAKACLIEALTAGPKAVAHYDKALARTVPWLLPGRELSANGDELPANLELMMANGVVWMLYQRLATGQQDRIETLLDEAMELIMRPYLGDSAVGPFAVWTDLPTRP
jgi:AcrR family transcriptional regulator